MIASEPARTDSCVARAFDALAPEYDAAWTSGLIGQFQRRSAWGEMLSVFRAGDRVLELGCGTGADAARLAAAGVRVHATDISPEMLRLAQERLESSGLSSQVTYELIAVEHLGTTRTPGLFDGAFSNFGALNCVEDMRGAAASLARLVRPGGRSSSASWGASACGKRPGISSISGRPRRSGGCAPAGTGSDRI